MDVALPGRDAAGCDGGDGSIAENIISEPLVDTMTTAVAEMDVDNRGEPKRPFSLCRIMDCARGVESHPVCPCISALT